MAIPLCVKHFLASLQSFILHLTTFSPELQLPTTQLQQPPTSSPELQLPTAQLQQLPTSSPEMQLPTAQMQQPPTSSPQLQPKPAVLPDHSLRQWQDIIMTFCFASALQIALQYVQNQFHLPLSFHLLSFAILITFALQFIAKLMSLRFPFPARVLGELVVFMAVTIVFYTISIPLPRGLKFAAWIIYALTMLTAAILKYYPSTS